MKKSISEIINASLKDDRALIITSTSIIMRGLTSLSIIRLRRRSTFKERHDQEEKKDDIPLYRRCYQDVVKRFTWEGSVAKTLDIYNDAVGG